MPIRHGGMLANRASTWPRDHLCRSTIAPRSSRPTTWNEFLLISMPITVIALLGFSDMACSLSLAPPASFNRWRGRRGRTIPLADSRRAHLTNNGYFNICRNMEKTDTVAALAALAQENRLDVFRLLVQAGPGG